MCDLNIVFVPDLRWRQITEPEILQTVQELQAEGIAVREQTALPAAPEENTLYLTDSMEYYQNLCAAGCAVAGYLHAGNPGAAFPRCPYLISEPQWVDADSYEKIYERLTGRPWTILTTDRLVIREMTVADVGALYELYDEEALRFMPPLCRDREEQRIETAEYIDKIYGMFGYGYWVMTLRDSGRVIGRMGFANEGSAGGISFGYMVHPDYRRQGYAIEAARAILPYAREMLQMSSICATVHTENEPSISLLRRLGFRRAGAEDGMETYIAE